MGSPSRTSDRTANSIWFYHEFSRRHTSITQYLSRDSINILCRVQAWSIISDTAIGGGCTVTRTAHNYTIMRHHQLAGRHGCSSGIQYINPCCSWNDDRGYRSGQVCVVKWVKRPNRCRSITSTRRSISVVHWFTRLWKEPYVSACIPVEGGSWKLLIHIDRATKGGHPAGGYASAYNPAIPGTIIILNISVADQRAYIGDICRKSWGRCRCCISTPEAISVVESCSCPGKVCVDFSWIYSFLICHHFDEFNSIYWRVYIVYEVVS